jgi:threonine synthase
LESPRLKCTICGNETPIKPPPEECSKCHRPAYWLHTQYPLASLKGSIDQILDSKMRGVWRYRPLLPVSAAENIVSLGEGGTPLIKSRGIAQKHGLSNLHFKNEGVNPTFSFKDREVSLAVSMAKELGLIPISIASSGNAGSALSAYSAKAGIKSVILTPSYTPNEKVVQMSVYGSVVLRVKGTTDTCRSLLDEGKKRFKWNPFNTSILRSFAIEGTKTISFELFEQLNYETPSVVIVPTGSGRGLLSMWKGFHELRELGQIERMPRMVSVQPSLQHPIVDAVMGESHPISEKSKPSIATALLVAKPPELALVANAIKSTDGLAVAVSDEEILRAESTLAKEEGVFAEPAAASSVAALLKLVESGQLARDEKIVCVITGSGLKDASSAQQAAGEAPLVEADLDALSGYLKF